MDDLKLIKEKYGEKMMHLCRKLFPTILETKGLLYNLLKSNFAYNKFLADDILNNNLEKKFQYFINGMLKIEETYIKDTDKTPRELFKKNDYIFFECKNEEDIQRFRKYYEKDELLCTFNGGRLKDNYVFFIVHKDAHKIKRSSFKEPKRDDKYSLSVLSIQFSRGNSNLLSIKSRYNHRVPNPDAVYSNNLENMIEGLTKSFEKYYNLNIRQNKKSDFEIFNYVLANDGKFYKYNYEINNIYYCPNNIIIDNGKIIRDYQELEKYIVLDYFILNLEKKQIYLYDNNLKDSFIEGIINIKKIDIIRNREKAEKTICIYLENKNTIEIILDNKNNIISYKDDNIKTINDNFMHENKTLKELCLENVCKIGSKFLYSNTHLEKIKIDNLKEVGDYFLYKNNILREINAPNIIKIGNYFLVENNCIKYLDFSNLLSVGNYFLCQNKIINKINFSKLIKAGDYFLSSNEKLSEVDFNNLESVGEYFLHWNKGIYKVNFSKLKYADSKFMECNRALKQVSFPELIIVKSNFLAENEDIHEFYAPKLQSVNNAFLRMNKKMEYIEFNNLIYFGDEFLLCNDKVSGIISNNMNLKKIPR